MADTGFKTPSSSIGFALAGRSDSVNIPKPRQGIAWAGKDSFAAVAARSAPGGPDRADLPTPPASISPSLPPQAFKDQVAAAPPTPPSHAVVDSDIDLQDAVEHARASDKGHSIDAGALASLDTHGAITPTLLAKHHLPDILLGHGPLAIRHVMGFLTTSVPGFSGIAPAKARRLVVAALEGRGGVNDDVMFEKVGWGRWDAHRRGQPSRSPPASSASEDRRQSPTGTRKHQPRSTASPHLQPQSTALRIPHRPRHAAARPSKARHVSISPNLQPIPFELETDADRMSLDETGDDRAYSSSTTNPDDAAMMEDYDDDDDATDEEDWQSIGAEALRQGHHSSQGRANSHSRSGSRMLSAYSRSQGGRQTSPVLSRRPQIDRRDSGHYAGVQKKSSGGIATPGGRNALARSAPNLMLTRVREGPEMGDAGRKQLDRCADEGEREAVAALLSLGGM